MRRHAHADAAAAPLEVAQPKLKRAANTVTWIKILVAAAVTLFAAGAASRSAVGKLATKDELEAAIAVHKDDAHPVILRRLDDMDRRQAETARDVRWLRFLLGRMAARQGVHAPDPLELDEPAPAMSAPP